MIAQAPNLKFCKAAVIFALGLTAGPWALSAHSASTSQAPSSMPADSSLSQSGSTSVSTRSSASSPLEGAAGSSLESPAATSTAASPTAASPTAGSPTAGSSASGSSSGTSSSSNASSDNPQPTVKKKRTIFRNLVYSTKSSMCSGDLYLPKKKEGPYPLVIVVHAGGWMTGDKNDFDSAELCIKLAIVGFAAYNINYRLVADGGTFPHSIDDVKDAVNFMAAHGQDYDIDPQKIALFGISAGANLSLIAAYNPDQDLPNGQKDNHLRVPIRAVVAYCPVIDLTTLDKPFVAKYMGDIPSHAAELYRQASPTAYVKTAVPTICIHGTGDTLIPYTESKKFVALLEKNGRQAKFVAVPDAVHLFVGGDKDLSFKPAVEFLGARFQ